MYKVIHKPKRPSKPPVSAYGILIEKTPLHHLLENYLLMGKRANLTSYSGSLTVVFFEKLLVRMEENGLINTLKQAVSSMVTTGLLERVAVEWLVQTLIFRTS